MTYKLTDAQKTAIIETDAVCRHHGIPCYYDFLKAAAMVLVAHRDANVKGAQRARTALANLVEGFRNDSASDIAILSTERPAVVKAPK